MPMASCSDWKQQFGDYEPISYELRRWFADRWVRFHSLPHSKRYPDNDSEIAIVLARHNRIMAELTERDRNVVLLTTGYSDSVTPVRSYADLTRLDPGATPWRSFLDEEGDEECGPSYWHVFASDYEWTPRQFDPIVRLIADDKLSNVMIGDPQFRWVLHPYDGGMDLILESPETRDRFKSAFREWLSDHPDGL